MIFQWLFYDINVDIIKKSELGKNYYAQISYLYLLSSHIYKLQLGAYNRTRGQNIWNLNDPACMRPIAHYTHMHSYYSWWKWTPLSFRELDRSKQLIRMLWHTQYLLKTRHTGPWAGNLSTAQLSELFY